MIPRTPEPADAPIDQQIQQAEASVIERDLRVRKRASEAANRARDSAHSGAVWAATGTVAAVGWWLAKRAAAASGPGKLALGVAAVAVPMAWKERATVGRWVDRARMRLQAAAKPSQPQPEAEVIAPVPPFAETMAAVHDIEPVVTPLPIR